MIPKLHYFNPGHETAVLSSTKQYTPSVTVQKMIKDLAVLPYWYADPEDYVLVKELPSDFEKELPEELGRNVRIISPQLLKKEKDHMVEMQASPWGISPHILHYYTQLKEKYNLSLHVPVWKEYYLSLTSRQTAAGCLNKLRHELPEFSFPSVPVFFSDMGELEVFVKTKPLPSIVKTPFSSSGRGLLWLESNHLGNKDKEWIKGAIRKQGMVSVEDRLTRLQDYGWEFYLDNKGKANYLGIVPFSTSEKGIYKGSALDNSDKIEQCVTGLLGGNIYHRTLEVLTDTIQHVYGGHYSGYLGVDMMLYQTSQNRVGIHPCVEINMRCTMGLVALKLRELLHPEVKGYFFISFDKTPEECLQQHIHMQEAYPLYMENEKIRKGYFSLCPVSRDTQYRAYILTF